MKKIIILLIVLILTAGCIEQGDINGTDKYQMELEEDGYIWIVATTGRDFFGRNGATGYIESETLDKYVNNELDSNYKLKIIHPYNEGEFVVLNISDIEIMSIK